MTILHIMQCTNLGGMEQVSYRVMRELEVSSGLTFRITTPRNFGPGKDIAHELDPDARDFPYLGRFGWRSFPPFRRHVRELADTCSHIWVTGNCAASLTAIQGLKKPKILSHHYHHFETRSSWLKWRGFYELLCRQLDAITYPTEFTRNEALRIAPWLESKAHVVPNGCELHYENEDKRVQLQKVAREKLNLPKDAWIVGNAGWLIPRKRFDIFLRTAAEVKNQLPHSYFVICGDGELKDDLQRFSYDLGLQNSIRFTGWVRDLTPYYQAFDLVLFTSDYDTLGMSCIEAAAHGCPTVASVNYGGLDEFIENGINGFLFGHHDPDALAGKLVYLSKFDALMLKFRQFAARKIEKCFNPKTSTKFYQDFFSQ